MAFVKIQSFKTYRFDLPLKQPLVIGKQRLTRRSGYLIELSAEDGRVSLGEVSPLQGLSRESLKLAAADMAGLRDAVLGRNVPGGLQEMSCRFEKWLPETLVPSVKFGFESAVLNLLAAGRGESLCRIICDAPRDSIPVNGLLAGSAEEVMTKAGVLFEKGYRAFKLKVGRRSIEEDADLTARVRTLIGNETTLRLDANRAWSIPEALTFCNGVAHCRIDYLEEPVKTLDDFRALVHDAELPVPLALDESLHELTPASLSSFSGIKAVILKPTLWGFEKTIQTARQAAALGMTPVVSSAFESGIGLEALAHIAACINRDDVPAGLDTLDIFEEDLRATPLPIRGGRLSTQALSDSHQGVRQHMLKHCDE
jgi:O-succinylbenzoate synthase